MRTLNIVVDKPLIQIFLKSLHTFIEVFPEGDAEEFIQYSLVEAFNETVGSRGFDLCPPVFNVI